MSKNRIFSLAAMALVLMASTAFASEGGDAGGKFDLMALGCVVGLGLAALGGGIGMGNAINGALSAMSRNPGFYAKIFTNFLIGMALIESLVIYTLVIVLILLFVL